VKWVTISQLGDALSLAAICALMSLIFCTGLVLICGLVNAAIALLAKPATVVSEIVEQDTFLFDVVAFGDIEPGDAADPRDDTRRDPKQDGFLTVVEHRCADGDVRKMSAAVIGGIDAVNVAGTNVAMVLADYGFNGTVHGAEMHGHVRRVGDQGTVMREHRAGKVQPLLDIHRVGGVLQRYAHLLGDRHEQIVENLQHDRVGMRADRMGALEFFRARQQEMIFCGHFGLPAGLDHDGLMRLDNDGGANDARSRLQLVTHIDICLVPDAG
jgi:hypothetical protein